jgi:hypothetical protein
VDGEEHNNEGSFAYIQLRVRHVSIEVVWTLAASYGLIVHQMDVKTTFLNGELDEEIYMDQPHGFVVKGEE